MSEKYKISEQGIPYFVTFTVVQWIDLFTRNEYREIIIESLKFCQQGKGLVIYAYCLMTNHIHMIISSKDGSMLENIIRDFRGFTSKELRKEIESNPLESRKKWMLKLFKYEGEKRNSNKGFQLWKRNYHPIEISSRKFFNEKVEYIHQNPVKAGFVYEPQEYIYSSAVNYAGRKGALNVVVDYLKVGLNKWENRIARASCSCLIIRCVCASNISKHKGYKREACAIMFKNFSAFVAGNSFRDFLH